MITVRLQATTLTPPALCFWRLRWGVCFFFSSTLFPAHTFHILILQTASYKTHACGVWLTLISGGCGVLRSTRLLHTKLKRPGTRSNRLGPDPDPDDHLKYRPEPVRIPGPRVSGPPWRPLEYTVDERAQRTATSENTCKSRKHLHQFDSRSCKCSQHKQRNALQILITQPNKEFYLQCVYLFGCVVSICSVFLYLVVVGAFAAHVLSNWWRCFLNLQVFFYLQCVELSRPPYEYVFDCCIFLYILCYKLSNKVGFLLRNLAKHFSNKAFHTQKNKTWNNILFKYFGCETIVKHVHSSLSFCTQLHFCIIFTLKSAYWYIKSAY